MTRDALQLALPLDLPDHEHLARRLEALGMTGVTRVRLTDNASVMVSRSSGGVLSIHRGYLAAPDRVLAAVVRLCRPRARRADRRVAQREILAFDAPAFAPTRRRARRRPEAPRPGDLEKTERLTRLFQELNGRHFGGALPGLPIRVSGRMRTRLGQLCIDPATGEPFEITISRRHLDRHGWNEAGHTLLHEMVHLWQSEMGYPVNHGPIFRSKARALGVTPSARRGVATAQSRGRAARYD